MAKKLTLKPLGARVLLREVEEEAETGGIVLPEDVEAERDFVKAEVVEIGTEKEEIPVKKGEQVLIDGFAGKVLEMNGTEYRIVKVEDILAIVK